MTVGKGARLSDDGAHRYMLWRTWGPGPSMTFVMLNPSTADAEVDDPTIRRCMGFARREGCGEIVVVNLFSYRTPDPRDLVDTIEAGVSPWGPEQARWMSSALQEAMPGVLVAAWGAHPVARLALHKLPTRYRWQCLGTTKSGAPRHPLYVKGDAPLVPFTFVSEGDLSEKGQVTP